MNLIYIAVEGGGQQAYEEVQVHDLLARKVLSPETAFWREGMTEWRPLSELPPHQGLSFVPSRRTEKSTTTPATPPAVPSRHQMRQDEDGGYWKRKAVGRYYFRFNPIPLTVSLQILIVISVALGGFFINECLGKAYGWNGDYHPGAANGAAISPADIFFLFRFFWGLLGLHLVIEVLFFYWVYYANKNSRGLTNNIIYTSGWAVAYFFIPLLNLFRPYQVMQEIWKVSEDPRLWMGRRDSIFVGFWFLSRFSVIFLAKGAYDAYYGGAADLSVRMQDTLIYLATVVAVIILIEATTLLLISAVVWRQRKWVRKGH